MPTIPPLTARMQAQLGQWRTAADDKALFLHCYLMMTDNMHRALERGEFRDGPWVEGFVEHFAGYYFRALECYDCEPATAPAVWQRAHGVCPDAEINALQKLLLGINAHINYDLVLTLNDLLRPQWQDLSLRHRRARYDDYRLVNEIIGRTIDAVQDEILEPAMPRLRLLDRLLGPVDELLLSRLITVWRDNVWRNVVLLLAARDAARQQRIVRKVEREALRTADLLVRRL